MNAWPTDGSNEFHYLGSERPLFFTPLWTTIGYKSNYQTREISRTILRKTGEKQNKNLLPDCRRTHPRGQMTQFKQSFTQYLDTYIR